MTSHERDSRIEIVQFGTPGFLKELLADKLSLHPPPVDDEDLFLQLELIERHLREMDNPGECKSVVIERGYIDRAFMDDYTAFYASSFRPYENSCGRLHFFSIGKEELEGEIVRLFDLGRTNGMRSLEFSRICEDFSLKNYLGFTVIKPLPGSPVGRTVLHHYSEDKGGGHLRKFNCTRHYKVHLLGLELTVCGLVFQQQDTAVSACATTALWTSLSRLKDSESLRTPSPAQITRLATQYYLLGRSMPQEDGLTVDQMCQAIQSLGLSPYLFRTNDLEETNACLHSAVLSGFAPILIIRYFDDRTKKLTNEYHAVTATGMKIKQLHEPKPINIHGTSIKYDDIANDLVAIYVNDDRFSPYYRVEITRDPDGLFIDFTTRGDSQVASGNERWKLTNILIPLHSKIRLSFAELREMSFELIRRIDAFKDLYQKATRVNPTRTTKLHTRIMKANDYIRHLFFGNNKLNAPNCEEFNNRISLPRYVGVVRLSDEAFGDLDILIDTTNVSNNPNYLAMVCRASNKYFSNDLVRFLSAEIDCPFIIE